MKRSLLALAVLGAFAGVASAQSSVTIYGLLNQAVGKPIGVDDRQLMDVAGSRIGFRGVEDLGGGLKALFGFEHRFDPSTGMDATATATSPGTFWQGYSTVGLEGAFGKVNLGRQYTPTFSLIQNQIDPFAGDGQGQLRGIGMLLGTSSIGGSTVANIRFQDSIRYDFSASGFSVGAIIAETPNLGVAPAGDSRPFAIAANYAAGPLFVGIGVEDPGALNDKLWNIGAKYNFGFATLAAGFSKGTTSADLDIKGWLIGATVPLGGGDLKFGYAQNSLDGDEVKKASVGYVYPLSKRTKLFADFGKVGGIRAHFVDERSGFDLGIQHNF